MAELQSRLEAGCQMEISSNPTMGKKLNRNLLLLNTITLVTVIVCSLFRSGVLFSIRNLGWSKLNIHIWFGTGLNW